MILLCHINANCCFHRIVKFSVVVGHPLDVSRKKSAWKDFSLVFDLEDMSSVQVAIVLMGSLAQ